MTATVTKLTPASPAAADPASRQSRQLRKAAQLAAGDLLVAARLLYTARETLVRKASDPDTAERVERVRADLLAVMAGEDTPSEIEFGDLAADASAYADEVEKLREDLESARGKARVYGKGN